MGQACFFIIVMRHSYWRHYSFVCFGIMYCISWFSWKFMFISTSQQC